MNYGISEASKRTGLSVSTLHYYDRMGLLPFVGRTTGGARIFKESDLEGLAIITCLKETGMPVKEIKEFLHMCMEGDSTLTNRLEVFTEQKRRVLEQISLLQKHMKKIEHKIWYYKTAVDAGTETIHNV